MTDQGRAAMEELLGKRNQSVRITGLWENKDKNGNMMLDGSLSPWVKIFIVKNMQRKTQNDPDYFFTIMQKTPKTKDDEGGRGKAAGEAMVIETEKNTDTEEGLV